jgi:hypothetical protein
MDSDISRSIVSGTTEDNGEVAVSLPEFEGEEQRIHLAAPPPTRANEERENSKHTGNLELNPENPPWACVSRPLLTEIIY